MIESLKILCGYEGDTTWEFACNLVKEVVAYKEKKTHGNVTKR